MELFSKKFHKIIPHMPIKIIPLIILLFYLSSCVSLPKERVDINSKPQEKLCAKLKIKEFFQGRNSNRPIESYTFKDAKVAPNHAIDWLPPLQLSNNYEKI